MQEVTVDKYGNLKDGRETVMVNGVALPSGNHPQENIARANTALLADAINTERKTGLTPSQLAEQRAELLGALKKINAIPNKDIGGDWEEIEEARDIATAAIAKCEAAK
jgi:hypothetical protein